MQYATAGILRNTFVRAVVVASTMLGLSSVAGSGPVVTPDTSAFPAKVETFAVMVSIFRMAWLPPSVT